MTVLKKNKYIIACNTRGIGDKLSCYMKAYTIAKNMGYEFIVIERFAYNYYNASEQLTNIPNLYNFFIPKYDKDAIYKLNLDDLNINNHVYSFLKTIQHNRHIYSTNAFFDSYDILWNEEQLFRKAITNDLSSTDEDVIITNSILPPSIDVYDDMVSSFIELYDVNHDYILDAINICLEYNTFDCSAYHLRSCGWHREAMYYWKPTLNMILNDLKKEELSNVYCCLDSLKTIDLIHLKYSEHPKYLKCQLFPEKFNINQYEKIRGHDTDLYSIDADIFALTYYSFIDALIFCFCKTHKFHNTSMFSFALKCLMHYLKCNRYI